MTMTRNDLNRFLCAVITSLDEVEYSPESALYMGCGSDPERWEEIKTVLVVGNLATFAADHTVRLTPAGHAMAAKINAYMAENAGPDSPYNIRKM